MEMAHPDWNSCAAGGGWPEPFDDEALGASLIEARQRYLDAMHMPAAALRLADGELEVPACNAAFRGLVQPFLSREGGDGAVAILTEFLEGEGERRQFAWRKPGFGGRHYRVHLSRLCASGSIAARALVSLVDRTAEIETERTLRAEMLRDSLTGLPNRQAFMDRVEAATGEGRPFALLAVDLVRFSRVNEGVGALAGDELVLTVARRLRSALGPEDMLARTAGDEFGVLVAQADRPEDAIEAAVRLRDSLNTPVRLSDLEIQIDAAIGCSLHGGDGCSAGDAVANVQVALKCAKRTGRIELFQPGEAGRVRRRFALETDLRRAVDRDELALAFQPLLDLDTGVVTGFEALARWTHGERGPISPAEFIPVAEESGLIVPLGRWALERAARTLADWDRRAGRRLPISLSVNVSAVQLARDSLVEAVEASRMDLTRLTLEITESSLVADPERVKGILAALHDRRCRVAMDDFGTGYSCLAYLQRLPIDVLKIDRSLITDMHGNRDSMAIVRAVLSLARALGLSTTAEGIENGETATLLTALGCTTGQGYLFAKPLPPDQAFDYLVSSRH
jgi:diguanylate cyclase (GGDEF)-like protein